MKTGICNISFIPMRKEASHRSEMVSQIVFGELYSIIDELKEWRFVRNEFDGYKGWVDANQVVVNTTEEYERLKNTKVKYPSELFSLISDNFKNLKFMIPFGSNLKFLKDEFTFEGSHINIEEDIRSQVIELASKFLNVPYLWGGRTPLGIDCSGFIQTIFKTIEINLLRDASQQTTIGKDIGFVNEAQAGDLAFFGDEENISHVGIVMGEGRIIHASGKVRIDKLDHHGIYNIDSKKYSHKLRLIKNVID